MIEVSSDQLRQTIREFARATGKILRVEMRDTLTRNVGLFLTWGEARFADSFH